MDEIVWCPPNIFWQRTLMNFHQRQAKFKPPMLTWKWSFQGLIDLLWVQLKWISETTLLRSLSFPSHLSRVGCQRAFLSSIHTNFAMVMSCALCISSWPENYFCSRCKSLKFFCSMDKCRIFTSSHDGTDPTCLQQQKDLPCMRMDRVANSILIPKFFEKKKQKQKVAMLTSSQS